MTDARAGPVVVDGRTDDLGTEPQEQPVARALVGPGRPPAAAAGLVLLTAPATGLLRQGAVFVVGQWAVGLFLAAAVLLALAGAPLAAGDLRLPAVPALAGLAEWTLLDAAVRP